ncbi:MAG TPA: WD40 repeat domain-containing protein, partial [Gemmataceae bacterium]|nr:WD40 repeat domain-containing protein [Gemmataceae bacterium]
ISRPTGDRPAEFVAKPGIQVVVTLKREKPALPGLIQTLNAAGPVTALAFHPTDSAQLFWGTQNGHCQVYDGQVRDLPRLGGPLPDEGVKCVVYTGTGDRMYVLFQLGGAYRFLKLRPGDLPGPLIYPGKFQAIAASPDGFILALASTTKNESKLSFLGPDNKDHGLADTPLGRHNRPVYAMAWPTEDLLVTGGEKGEVIVWDSKTGQKKQTPKLNFLPLGILKSVAITRDGQYILAADGLRFVVNRGDDLRFASENPKLGLAAVVLSPAEPLVAWITGKTIYIQHVDWVQAKTLALEDSPESGELLSLAFSHDGKRLAFGTTRGKVHILEVSKIPSR